MKKVILLGFIIASSNVMADAKLLECTETWTKALAMPFKVLFFK